MPTYKLSSTPGVYTPGLVRYIRHVAKDDKELGRHMITEAFPTLSIEAINKLLLGEYNTNESEEAIILEVQER